MYRFSPVLLHPFSQKYILAQEGGERGRAPGQNAPTPYPARLYSLSPPREGEGRALSPLPGKGRRPIAHPLTYAHLPLRFSPFSPPPLSRRIPRLLLGTFPHLGGAGTLRRRKRRSRGLRSAGESRLRVGPPPAPRRFHSAAPPPATRVRVVKMRPEWAPSLKAEEKKRRVACARAPPIAARSPVASCDTAPRRASSPRSTRTL